MSLNAGEAELLSWMCQYGMWCTILSPDAQDSRDKTEDTQDAGDTGGATQDSQDATVQYLT